ncbi:MAG: hypothetical protein COB37_07365 [Kordiimonadales bacterium]|nr:MAG: hypothetical protein COB37_07365 [Kordiimonadales bacterium]
MSTALQPWFDTTDYMPHGMCYLWNPSLLWAHALSDLIIGLSYFSVAFAVVYLLRNREDVPFRGFTIMFGFVIFAACGATHFMGIWTIWNPDYGVAAIFKVFAALVSLITAILLWPITPKLVALPSIAQLEDVNARLAQQVIERQKAEMEVRDLNLILEKRVEKRTRQLQESEQKFRAIFNQTFQFIGMLSPEGLLRKANETSLVSVGLKAEDVIGKPLWETPWWNHSEEEQKAIKSGVEKAARGEFVRFEATHKGEDGGTLWVDFSLKPSFNDQGDVEFLISESRDITDRKLSEVALHKAKEQAEKSSKVKSEFLSSMSHELRTPLNAILGFAQMLKFDLIDQLSEKKLEYLDYIHEGGEQLLGLVNEVLDLSRIESGASAMDFEDVNANEVLESCLDITAPLGTEETIRLVNNFSTHGNVLLRADRSRMKQVVMNLLTNAFQFNKKNGEITVDGKVTDDGFLKLTIEDTGIGIPKNRHCDVFQIFNRHVGDAYIAYEGKGLGLATSKLLVEQMGGEMGFQSEENKGSSFWFSLPLVGPTLTVKIA